MDEATAMSCVKLLKDVLGEIEGICIEAEDDGNDDAIHEIMTRARDAVREADLIAAGERATPEEREFARKLIGDETVSKMEF